MCQLFTVFPITDEGKIRSYDLRVSLLCCTFLGGHRAALKSPGQSETPGREVDFAERVEEARGKLRHWAEEGQKGSGGAIGRDGAIGRCGAPGTGEAIGRWKSPGRGGAIGRCVAPGTGGATGRGVATGRGWAKARKGWETGKKLGRGKG